MQDPVSEMSDDIRRFDLNMKEDLLEAWGPSDGVRELISNALDEQTLTETKPIEITFQDERAQVRDFGRGLRYENFAQGEDEEKLANPDKVIGKFGVGLKDAMAVLYRHKIDVSIHSAHNTFTVEQAPKADFDDVETLHAVVHEPDHPEIEGTAVVLTGISEEDVQRAKDNFLQFSSEELIDATPFGEIYRKLDHQDATIYVTGLKVATEPGFLFSYNITNTTKNVRDALNRERSNVGRTAYTPRVKKILQEAQSEEVAELLIEDLELFTKGTAHEELGWKPIRLHAAKLMNSLKNVVFATVTEQHEHRDLLDTARNDGYDVITVPDDIRYELEGATDVEGNDVRDIGAYTLEYNESFEYKWVAEQKLSRKERKVWDLRHKLLGLVDEVPEIRDIRISETMRITGGSDWKTLGTWDRNERRIIVHRPVLQDQVQFASILLHEVAHPVSDAPDQTREFEKALTYMLGSCAIAAIEKDAGKHKSGSFLSRWFS